MFRTRARADSWHASILVVLLSLLTSLFAPAQATVTSAAPPPNIVLILSDDQRWDTLWAMPQVEARLAAHGITFSNAFVTNSLCCPSRTTILTGKYSHSTGVYTNAAPDGGFHAFHDRSTIATWLQAGGYQTALVGKYLNEYGWDAHHGYVPDGWDRWVALAEENSQYYNYDLTIDGRIRSYGHDPDDYATDVLAGYATSFIRNTKGPLFLYFAPPGPHDPADPAPRDEHAFPDLQPWRPPNFNEADVKDKSLWVRSRSPVRADPDGYVARFRQDQYRSLLAVDRAVGQILDALQDTGRLSNTFIVFMSDNGYMWGEHRLIGKQVSYEESIRVPMVIRFDPLTEEARTDDHLVLNMDLAPTFAELAGVKSPGVEGRSLSPLLRAPGSPWRTDFLIEHERGIQDIPSYCAVRTVDEKYVLYSTGEQELYDLSTDPFELQNVAADPAMQDRVSALRKRVDQLCTPRPPGFPGRPQVTP